MSSKPWYASGLRFECTQCGKCCKNHGQYTFVNLSELDLQRIPAFLGIARSEFLARYCMVERGFHPSLRIDTTACPFLDDSNRCRIYPVRPIQCETWPFWKENLKRETWDNEVRRDCPGIGRGPLYDQAEIERRARETEAPFE